MLVPTTLSLVTTGFPEPRARAKALSLLTAAAAAGGALGGVIGGRAHRAAQLALGLLRQRAAGCSCCCSPRSGRCPAGRPGTCAGGSTCRDRSRSPPAPPRWSSAVILGEERGWASATTLACLGLSVAAFVLFVLVERRAEQPVVPLWVFRVRPVTVANGLSALVGGMLPATMFFLVLYLQRVLGMDPLQAGLALTPGAVGIALGARGASRWIGVLGPAPQLRGRHAASPRLRWPGSSQHRRRGPLRRRRARPADPGHGRVRRRRAAADRDGDVRPRARSGPAWRPGLLATARQVGSAVGLAALVAVAAAWAAGAEDSARRPDRRVRRRVPRRRGGPRRRERRSAGPARPAGGASARLMGGIRTKRWCLSPARRQNGSCS